MKTSRLSLALASLLTLTSHLQAQYEPPDVGSNGFVAFAERFPVAAGPGDGDVVTILNGTAATGAIAGAVLTGPAVPAVAGGFANNASVAYWRLNGQLAGNEQIRGRLCPKDAPLTVFDDTATSGTVHVLVPTLSSAANGSVPRIEVLTVSGGGVGTFPLLLLPSTAAPGPYPPLIDETRRRVYVSTYEDATSGPNPVGVYMVDLSSGAPALAGFYAPPVGQDQVARSAGYMTLASGGRLQLPCENAVHSIEWTTPAAPTAVTIAVPDGQVLGSDVRALPYAGTGNAVFCTRATAAGLTASAILYNPTSGAVVAPIDFGTTTAGGAPWALPMGFHTPAISRRIQGTATYDVVSVPLVGPPYTGFTGLGQMHQITWSANGGVNAPVLLGGTPFGEVATARNADADPVVCMLAGGARDYVQAVGTGGVFNFNSAGLRTIIDGRIGTLGPSLIPGPTSLPGGDAFVVTGDFPLPVPGTRGSQVFRAAATAGNAPVLVSNAVTEVSPFVGAVGASTNHTIPYLNGPLGDLPLWLHGFSGVQVAGAQPPVIPTANAAPLSATVGGPGAQLPNLTNPLGFLVPQLMRGSTSFSGGPRVPVFLHDGAEVRAAFPDQVGGVGRITIQLTGGVATYSPGTSTFVSELATF